MTTAPADWTAYYDRNTTSPPEPTLLTALDAFARPGFAVDLGCGQGRDTRELLRRGWHVLAIDADADGISRLRSTHAADLGVRLDARHGRFEEQTWPQADLVNASLTLGWCTHGEFTALWRRIDESLPPGGRFAGQFHGTEDRGGGFPTTTRLSRDDIATLFQSWKIESWTEEEVDAMTPFGIPKHRHLHHIVAMKQ